jgi:Rha family phage regulatory protein
MYDLTLIKQNGGVYIDSREVAELIGKRHDNLLRDIAGYIKILKKSADRGFEVGDFFLESTYFDKTGRELPCYLLSKMACELVGNRLIGERDVLFTAAYVTRFNALERKERAELEALAFTPRKPERLLGEINACSRLIISGMKALGATPEQIMHFLKETYEPLGFDMELDIYNECAPRWHNANGIAGMCGMFSLSGKPHGQAAASILKEILLIDEKHMRSEKDCYGFPVGISTLYDEYAMFALLDWLRENHYPEDIAVLGRTYHVQYQF